MTHVIHSPDEFRVACDAARASGGRVGLVPTMGALHEGHESLMHAVRRERADFVAVSIFVNPLQFAPTEDFGAYPRTLDRDLERCRANDVDLVFAPSRDAMFPAGFQTHVVVERLAARWEGVHRPEHFRGVATVVARLFGLAGPCVAAFGRKDYQQWKICERLAHDLGYPVDVLGCAIVREADGLAMSSRNRYLNADDRARAIGLVTALRAGVDAFARGEKDTERLRTQVERALAPHVDAVDYVAVADPDTLEPVTGTLGTRTLVALAARVGPARLIDNVVLGEDPRP